MGKNNFVEPDQKIGGDTTVNYKTKRSFNLQPTKNNYLRSSSKKAGTYFLRRIENKQDGCSSEKERKVNALALRADEGRDYLR